MRGEDIMITGMLLIATATVLFLICRILLQVKKNHLRKEFMLYYHQNE